MGAEGDLMPSRHVEYTFAMRAIGEPDSDQASIEIREHCFDRAGQLLCAIEVGPFGLDRDTVRMCTTAFEEALAHAIDHLTGGVRRRIVH